MSGAPLHYFSPLQQLSLSAVDANTQHIAELERRVTQYVGPDLPRFAREGLAFFTPEGAPELPEGTTEPGPAAKKDTLWAPGILERIAFTEVYDAPCLQAGVAYIPLATQRMSSSSEGATMTPMPGAVRDVVYLEGLTEPLIDKGQVQLPLAQSYAADDELQEQTAVAGGLCGVTCGECWEVRDGTVYVPSATTAATDAEGNTTPAIPGVLSGVVVEPELPHPDIRAGVLRLPLADHDSAAGRFDVPGLIKRVEIDEELQKVGLPRISAGVLRLPPMLVDPADMPTQVTGSISSLSCEGTEWTIKQGVINIPRAYSTAQAEEEQPGVAATPGVVSAILTGDSVEDWEIQEGVIYVPYAHHYPEGEEETVPGVIKGCRWSTDSGITEPCILRGELVIPSPASGVHSIYDQSLNICGEVDADGGLKIYDVGYNGDGVGGLLRGCEYDSGVTEPTFQSGVLKLPRPGVSSLLGLRDISGNSHTWEQVEGYAGSQVQVAGLSLQLAENSYATFYLNAGIMNGYLTFSLSAE